MKTLIKFSLFVAITLVALHSCKKEENQVVFEGGTAPALKASSTGPFVLVLADKNNPALSFSWTNPNYNFNSGLSSQDVTYTLQIDTVGSNFKNPNMSQTPITKDLSVALTVGELNKKFLNMNIPTGVSKNYIVRVKSTLATNAVPLYSNVLNFTATAYLDAAVTPPGTAALGYTDGKLFLVGDATLGGWNNPVPVPTQKFTQVDATHYEITVTMVGGKEYLMLPVNGDWGSKYGVMCDPGQGNSCNPSPNALDFKAQGDNIKGPAGGGTYTIKVNFITGKITLQ
jgi:starch-binding outer membrane protein SusE/F